MAAGRVGYKGGKILSLVGLATREMLLKAEVLRLSLIMQFSIFKRQIGLEMIEGELRYIRPR
jgi:hypothetical protein